MSRMQRFEWRQQNALRQQQRRHRRPLRIESLEDRRVLASDANIVFSTNTLLENEQDYGFADAIQLDGTGDAVNLAAGEADFDTMTQNLTIEAWIKVDQFDAANQTILSKGNLWSLHRSGTSNTIDFDLAGVTLTGTTDVNDGNWHHVAGVFNSFGFGTVSLYIDGVREDLFVANIGGGASIGTNNVDATIGATANQAGREFNGSIDEVRIWNIARSQLQINQSMRTTLSGVENGLIGYYTFDGSDGADKSSRSNDGTLLGDPTFDVFDQPSLTGYVEVQLDQPVTEEPGVILYYDVSTGGAEQGEDYYSSQIDLSTTLNPPDAFNGVYIPKGAQTARISLAALPDAIAEGDESFTITLLADTFDPFQIGGPSYTLGGDTVANITIRDSGEYTPGIAISDVYGQNLIGTGNLELEPTGDATLFVRLTSQPTDTVTLSLGNNVSGANLDDFSLQFDETDWYLPQTVTITGPPGDADEDRDFIGNISFDPSSSDSGYNALLTRFVSVYDESETARLRVEEGAPTQTITPTVSILAASGAEEGNGQPGAWIVSSDLPAPAGGLKVLYNLADDSQLDLQYALLDGGVEGNSRFVTIPAGALSTAILLEAFDDQIADGSLSVTATLVDDDAYDPSATANSDTLTVTDNDDTGIETALLRNLGSLDTLFDTGVDVNGLFTFSVESFTQNASGAEATITVSVNGAPVDDLQLTLGDANSAASETLNFDKDNLTPQTANLSLSYAADGGLRLDASLDANLDPDYGGISFTLPFRRLATPFDAATDLTTSESGDNFTFGVRLKSEPIGAVQVAVSSSDATEGQVSENLAFDAANWDRYQTVTVVAQDDSFLDEDRPYNVIVEGQSALDALYDLEEATFEITNQDDESRVEPGVEILDDSPIIAGITPVTHDAGEGVGPAQFEISLTAPAPAGGLTVGYVLFEGSATKSDLGIPRLIERTGDGNPLALTVFEQPDGFIGPLSLSFADIDNDGDQDALLSLDNGVTQLLINEGTPQVPDFVEDTTGNPVAGIGGGAATMGDVDGDGDTDIIRLSGGGVRYYESQLIDSGSLSFVERVGAANPFDGVSPPDPRSATLADTDNDGQLELFVTRSSGGGTASYYELQGDSYVVGAENPFAAFPLNNAAGIGFGDWDNDGDLDAFVGGTFDMRYFENIGRPSDPLFVERTGDFNPADGISGGQHKPALVDINNDGDLDLFTPELVLTGEVSSLFSVRYFESPEFQQAFIPEGQTNLVVQIPVINDDVDESDERFQAALLSQQTETYDLVTTDLLNEQIEIVVTQALAGGVIRAAVQPGFNNINVTEIPAGTVLTFSGGAQATVTSDTYVDFVEFDTEIELSLNVGTTIGLGETADVPIDNAVSVVVLEDFDGSSVGLRIGGNESSGNLVLEAGQQLAFTGGTTLEVTEKTIVSKFSITGVPTTLVSGSGDVFFDETAEINARVGELPLLVDEPGIDFFAISAGTELTLSDGSIFVVTEQELLSSVLQGDYNGDGVVNAIDYTVWRDTQGSNSLLDADGDGSGVVDQADYNLWSDNYGKTAGSGVYVTGVVKSPAAPLVGSTTNITRAGYRTSADLTVTSAFDGTHVGIQIDETAYDEFTIPAGTVIEFSGGASAQVVSDASINNSGGTLVEIALTEDTTSQTILLGESSSTSDYFSGISVVTTEPGVDDGFIYLSIVDASPGQTYEIQAGSLISFASGAVVEVASTVTLSNDNPFGDTEVEAFIHPSSTVPLLTDIMAGDVADLAGFEIVGDVELTIADDDEAGVTLTPLGDTSTSESGDSEDISVVLQTEPKDDVVVVLGVDSSEALLTDSDESNQPVVQLLFTPLNWDTAQTVTVTGVDDDVDDGNTSYAIRTTVLSQDYEYTDDSVAIFPTVGVENEVSASFLLDDIIVTDTIVSSSDALRFDNGAVLNVNTGGVITNSEPQLIDYSIASQVDTIRLNETAIVNDGDERTIVLAASAYDDMAGTIDLRIDPAETAVTSATFKAGYEFLFDNGAVARLTADATLTSGPATTVQAAIVEGAAIANGAASFFEENLIVTTTYSSADNTVGLEVDNTLISEIVLAANAELEFSNGALFTLATGAAFSNSTENVVGISAIGVGQQVVIDGTPFQSQLDVTTDYDGVSETIGLQLYEFGTLHGATIASGSQLTFSNGAVIQLNEDAVLDNLSETVVSATLVLGAGVTTAQVGDIDETLAVVSPLDASANAVGLVTADPAITSLTFRNNASLIFTNGVRARLVGETTFNNVSESAASLSLDVIPFTSKATAFFNERLVDDLIFTNVDDDGVGVTVFQTDPGAAIAEGASNNFFSVVLDAEPVAPVEITLAPSDDNIGLEGEFMGESITLLFDASNWSFPQAIEVRAIDDALLEYDHTSKVALSVASADPLYQSVTLPPDVMVFIEDNDLPSANIVPVAGAIESNAPGYFMIELDTPAPSGHDDTGIIVTYQIGGTADAVGVGGETPDVQPIFGTTRIAPGQTQSPLIAFPIDDFKTEGIDLRVSNNFNSATDDELPLQINIAPFTIGVGAYDSLGGTVELSLQSSVPDTGETTILSVGTKLLFAGTTFGVVTKTTIVGEDFLVDVPIDLFGASGDIVAASAAHQEVPLPMGTELAFEGGVVLKTTETVNVSNKATTLVDYQFVEGDALALTTGTPSAATTLQGESVVVTLTSDGGSEYRIGGAGSAAITILDNDKPGVRVAEIGDVTTAIEGEGVSQFFVSLLSQPESDVTLTLTNPQTTRTLEVVGAFGPGAADVVLQLNDTEIDSLYLPQGVYDFGGVNVTTTEGVTIIAGAETSVPATLDGLLNSGATHGYAYNEIEFIGGSETLVFNSDNWFQLQTVTIAAVDDSVVELGDSHNVVVEYGVSSTDPNYNGLEVNDQLIELIDRRFDVQETYQSIAQGFLALEDSIENVSLPIIGDVGEVAPSFFEGFLDSLVGEIRGADNLTVETLGDAFEAAINAELEGLPFVFEVTEILPDELSFLLSFSDSLMSSVPLNSDLGLEALNIGIETEGTIDLQFDYNLSIGFGINTADGFFFNTEETTFEVTAGVALSEDFAATGSLGFLQLDIGNAIAPVPISAVGDLDEDNGVIVLRIDDPEIESFEFEGGETIVFDAFEVVVAEAVEIDGVGVEVPLSSWTGVVLDTEASVVGDVDGTMIDASFVVTLQDSNDTSGDETRLTLSEIVAARQGSDPYSLIDYGFSGEAKLDLDISTSVSGNTSFPSFGFNLASDLPLFNYANEDEAGAEETPTLTLDAPINSVAEGGVVTVMMTVSGVTQNARVSKGTQLTFGGDKLIVDKTVTFAPDGSQMVRVKVADAAMGSGSATVGAGETATLASSAFNLAFNDITLDLGGFVNDLLGPIITGINDVFDPIKPVIDVLSSEVELLSKIGLAGLFDQDDDGVATLVEVALTLGGGLQNGNVAARFTKFVDAVTGVIELSQSLEDLEASILDGSLAINFGSYELQNFKGASSSEDASQVDAESEGVATDPDTAPEDQTKATGNSRVSNFFGKLEELGISLDVVENPLNVIKIFLGQDIDLVTWDAPVLDLGFSIEKSFPVFLGIRGLIRGEFNVYSDLYFGFDTFGFSQWEEEGFGIEDAYLVFDGFYLSDVDPETGEDVDELTLDATIAAGVQANAVIASVEAVGGLSGTAGLDIVDIGEYSGESDGRIRGSEIASRINRPQQLFEFAGTIDAFLSIAVKIGINLGFWKIEKTVYEQELARVTLFEFMIGGGGQGGSAATSSIIADTTETNVSLEEPAPLALATAPAEEPASPAPVALVYGPAPAPIEVNATALQPVFLSRAVEPVENDTLLLRYDDAAGAHLTAFELYDESSPTLDDAFYLALSQPQRASGGDRREGREDEAFGEWSDEPIDNVENLRLQRVI